MNIWCAAKNYLTHAIELRESVPKTPVFFLKAGSCFVEEGRTIHLPSFSEQVEYEIEIALRFDSRLEIHEAGIAIDLTARDLQAAAKKEGLPWTLSKSFPQSCLVGKFYPFFSIDVISELSFQLSVNGELRQQGRARDMIFSPRVLKEYLTAHFPVEPGDLLLTGTPAGISRVCPGDQVEASLEGRHVSRWVVA